MLNEVILTAGQLALALAGIASCMALLCLIFAMLGWIVRTIKTMAALDRPSNRTQGGADRPVIGGGMRRW